MASFPADLETEAVKSARSPSRWEVADIFREYGHAYRCDHPVSLLQRKVMFDIEDCRTARLGGHLEWCTHCHYQRYAYHSCRNRHCPKCQTLTKVKWVEARKAELLPVPYFHNVFTLPHELNPIILANKRGLLSILFHATAETLAQFGRQNLGGKIGFTAVLHTWDQTLGAHFHLHCAIPAGVLAEDHRWIHAQPRFLFPVRAVSRVFRGKFLDALRQAFGNDELRFPGKMEDLGSPEGFEGLIRVLRSKDWVVYSKRPFAGPEQVLNYLSRYTHRVAITNNRILAVRDGKVAFTYRDRRRVNQARTMTLSAEEFTRRFLLHVIPRGFVRIRHCGFLANRCKQPALKLCREALNQAPEPPPCPQKTSAELMLQLTGTDITRCPSCGQGPLRRIRLEPRGSLPNMGSTPSRSPPLANAS
jgi:hypothetical protein